MQKVAVFSKKIIKIKNINHFFPDLIFTDKKIKKQANAIAGWGLRPTTKKARKYATENKLPFISLEDGFLRSVGLGLEGYSPLSLIADSVGIYYDARSPSELENLIKSLFYPPQNVKNIKMKYRMMTSSSSNFPLKN